MYCLCRLSPNCHGPDPARQERAGRPILPGRLARMQWHYPDVRLIMVDQKEYLDVAWRLGAVIPNWEYERPGISSRAEPSLRKW